MFIRHLFYLFNEIHSKAHKCLIASNMLVKLNAIQIGLQSQINNKVLLNLFAIICKNT